MRRHLTIGETAKLLKMTTSQIRFYEKKGLVTPSRFDDNGYRLYSFQDLDKLETIQALRKLNIPIAEIKELDENEEDYDYLKLVDDAIDNIEGEINSLSRKLNLAKRLKKHYMDFVSFGPGIIHYPERKLYILDDDLTISRSEKDMYEFINYYDFDYTDHQTLFYTVKKDEMNILCAHNNELEDTQLPLDIYRLQEGDYYTLNLAVEHNVEEQDIENILFEHCQKEGLEPQGEFITIEDFNTYSRNLIHLSIQIRVI